MASYLDTFWSPPAASLTPVQRAQASVSKVQRVFGGTSLFDRLLGDVTVRVPKSLIKWLGETEQARRDKLDKSLVKYFKTHKLPKADSLSLMMALRFFTHPYAGLSSASASVECASDDVEALLSEGYAGTRSATGT